MAKRDVRVTRIPVQDVLDRLGIVGGNLSDVTINITAERDGVRLGEITGKVNGLEGNSTVTMLVGEKKPFQVGISRGAG